MGILFDFVNENRYIAFWFLKYYISFFYKFLIDASVNNKDKHIKE